MIPLLFGDILRTIYAAFLTFSLTNGVQVPQPTLDEKFAESPPTRGPEDTHAWLNAEEKRYILWGLKEHRSAARIGRALGVNEATVRRFRKRFWQRPELLLDLGLSEMVGRARDDEFRCLVCGDHLTLRREMQRHILRHYLDRVFVDAFLPQETDNDEGQEREEEG